MTINIEEMQNRIVYKIQISVVRLYENKSELKLKTKVSRR